MKYERQFWSCPCCVSFSSQDGDVTDIHSGAMGHAPIHEDVPSCWYFPQEPIGSQGTMAPNMRVVPLCWGDNQQAFCTCAYIYIYIRSCMIYIYIYMHRWKHNENSCIPVVFWDMDTCSIEAIMVYSYFHYAHQYAAASTGTSVVHHWSIITRHHSLCHGVWLHLKRVDA